MKQLLPLIALLLFSSTAIAIPIPDVLELEGTTKLSSQKTFFTRLKIIKTKIISDKGQLQDRWIGTMTLSNSVQSKVHAFSILFDRIRHDQESGQWVLFYQGPPPSPVRGLLNVTILGHLKTSREFRGQLISNQILPDGSIMHGEMDLS